MGNMQTRPHKEKSENFSQKHLPLMHGLITTQLIKY